MFSNSSNIRFFFSHIFLNKNTIFPYRSIVRFLPINFSNKCCVSRNLHGWSYTLLLLSFLHRQIVKSWKINIELNRKLLNVRITNIPSHLSWNRNRTQILPRNLERERRLFKQKERRKCGREKWVREGKMAEKGTESRSIKIINTSFLFFWFLFSILLLFLSP